MDAKEALELFTETKAYWSEIYQEHESDVRFSVGEDQWSDQEIKDRGQENCMIMPVLPQFIHQVMNDERQNTPSINVLPSEDEDSDQETAKIFKGLIRDIEYKSKADSVYDTAGEYAVRGGFGFIGVDHDYISEDSFLQELKLRRFQNPRMVYIDRNSVAIDGSDAEIAFVLDTIGKKDFEKKYPGKEFTSFSDQKQDAKADSITICEVFHKEYEEIEKELTDTGEIIDFKASGDEEADNNKKRKKLRKVKIKRYKFSGADKLESTIFPGKYIPIVPCYGEEVWVDGKRRLLSLIRLAKDAQRLVNRWAQKEVEILNMAPVAPILAPIGSIENIPDGWNSPDGTVVLRYRTVDSAGNKLDKPERLLPPPAPTGFLTAKEGAKQGVKEALGMYNASIGAKSNAISGVAYDAQKLEADVATYHFGDNRNKAIEQCGRILVCAIPEVYDTDRIIRIIGDEEEAKLVGINGKMHPDQKEAYDLRKGQYEVRVTTGASYTTKRQEAAALFGDVLKGNPELIGVIGDLWAKNLDVAGASAMAARLKKTVPKELLEEDDLEEGEKPVDPEKVQMGQIIQQLQAQLQQVGTELQDKQADQQAKAGDLAIKQEEVNIKKGELAIKQQDMQLKYLQAAQGSTEGKEPVKSEPQQPIPVDEPIEVLQARIQQKIQSAQNADQIAAAQQEQDLLNQQMEAQREQEEQEKEDKENHIKMLQTQAVIDTLGGIQNTLAQLTAQTAQPIQITRDPTTGVITGAN